MAMDYGDAKVADRHKMGDNPVQAVTGPETQLMTIDSGETDAKLWHMVGGTPMLGLTEVSRQVFTVTDAQKLLQFARQRKFGRLAMWSKDMTVAARTLASCCR